MFAVGFKTLEDAQHLLGWLTVGAVRHQFGVARMALSGVRSLWLILARNCDLCWLALSSCRVLSWISSNKRTFSMAIAAWSAKVVTSSTCLSENGCTSERDKVSTPIGMPSRNIGTARTVRKSPNFCASTQVYCGSAFTSAIW